MKCSYCRKVISSLVFLFVICGLSVLSVHSESMEHKAYVANVAITNIVDGTGPFDLDDAAGNDSSDSNLRVRTYDTISYSLSSNLALVPGWSTPVDRLWLGVEVILPLSDTEAEFAIGSMGWLNQSEGRKPHVEIEQREIDGTLVDCQILYGWRYLVPADGNHSVAPGSFSEDVVIRVKSCQNGKIFTPRFSFLCGRGVRWLM